MRTKKRVSLAFIITMLTLFCFMGSIISPYAHAEEFRDDSVATSDSQTTEEKEEKTFWDSFLGFIGMDTTPNIVFKLEVANKKINSGDTVQVKKGDSITVKAYLKDYKNADESVGSLSVEYPQSETGKYSITNETLILSDSEKAETNESTNMFVYCPIKDTSTSALETDPCPVIPKGTTADTDLFSFKVNVDQNISVNNFSITLKNITMGDENDDFIESDNSVVYDCGTEDTVTVNFEVINNSVNIPVTGIELDQDVIYPIAGKDPVQLMAKVIPENATNPTVNWSSAQNTIATVDNGSVSAGTQGYGTTTITATTADGNMTDTCTANVSFAYIEANTLNLKESISINYYARMSMPESLNNDYNRVALKLWPKNEADNFIIDCCHGTSIYQGVTEYLYTYDDIYSPYMNKVICSQFIIDYDGDGVFETLMGEVKEYSVLEYALTKIKYSTDNNLVALLKSLLNYGASAQEFFNINKDNLANSALAESEKTIPTITSEDLKDYAVKYISNQNKNLFEFSGNTLELLNKVNLRIYYTPTEDNTMSEEEILALKFKYKIVGSEDDYKTLAINKNPGVNEYYSFIDLPSNQISNMYEVYVEDANGEQISDIQVCGVYAYAEKKLRDGSTEALKKLCMAIIDYGKKAQIYFPLN